MPNKQGVISLLVSRNPTTIKNFKFTEVTKVRLGYLLSY